MVILCRLLHNDNIIIFVIIIIIFVIIFGKFLV